LEPVKRRTVPREKPPLHVAHLFNFEIDKRLLLQERQCPYNILLKMHIIILKGNSIHGQFRAGAGDDVNASERGKHKERTITRARGANASQRGSD